MAADWIKMRGNLWDDPRVARLCDLCDVSEATVIGGLYWLWATADQHTEDGVMPGLTLRQINRKTGIDHFGEALCEVGWIEDFASQVVIARFSEHNGSSAKRRAAEAQRKANARKSSDESAHQVGNLSAQNADSLRTDCAESSDNVQTKSGRHAELEKEKSINTPHTPQRGAKRSAVSFKTWAQQVRESSEKLIPDDDPVFDYAREVELPDDFLTLAWIEFKARYSAEGAKRYKDFRSVFRKAVRGNWFKLWAIDAGGAYYLTTVGKQAERARQEVAA